MPRRRRRKQNVIDSIYWELASVISSEGKVFLENNNIIIDARDPYALWSRLQDYCEEVVIGDYQRVNMGEDLSLIEIYCASKKTKVLVRMKGLVNLLAFTPVFLLYDKKACIKGLKAEVNVL
ncbi:hypothetical protein J4526_05190 [Desulfurococcaceae archaeon MEX13E-LK6-19]|nr:hypothetical protein J4526_05190 [Desulfurococcaceae archaeon MEX13E-LK6-19]